LFRFWFGYDGSFTDVDVDTDCAPVPDTPPLLVSVSVLINGFPAGVGRTVYGSNALGCIAEKRESKLYEARRF
jgi:hypothetical protein